MDKPFTPSVAAPSQHNVAGQDGKKGLGLRQVGVAKVVKTTLREDLGTSLEPHGLTELHTSVLGQERGGHAAESSQHSPTGVDQLSLTVGSKGGGVSTQTSRVPTVVTGQLTSQVSRGGSLGVGAQTTPNAERQ